MGINKLRDSYGKPPQSGGSALSVSVLVLLCEKNRTNPAPVCPQKTVYGANVIVFEGILAFANKELLKVSLPQVAPGAGGDVLEQEQHWGLWGGRGARVLCVKTPRGGDAGE